MSEIVLLPFGILAIIAGLRILLNEKEGEQRRKDLTISLLRRPGSLWENRQWEDNTAWIGVTLIFCGILLILVAIF